MIKCIKRPKLTEVKHVKIRNLTIKQTEKKNIEQ